MVGLIMTITAESMSVRSSGDDLTATSQHHRTQADRKSAQLRNHCLVHYAQPVYEIPELLIIEVIPIYISKKP